MWFISPLEKLPNLPRSYSANQLQKIKPPKDAKVAKTQTISNESQPKIIRQKHHVPSKSLASKKHAKTCGTQTEVCHKVLDNFQFSFSHLGSQQP